MIHRPMNAKRWVPCLLAFPLKVQVQSNEPCKQGWDTFVPALWLSDRWKTLHGGVLLEVVADLDRCAHRTLLVLLLVLDLDLREVQADRFHRNHITGTRTRRLEARHQAVAEVHRVEGLLRLARL